MAEHGSTGGAADFATAAAPARLEPVAAQRRALRVLHLVFFVSGVCALAYQTAWQRMLGLFGGSDTVSATIVVGAFLFGLGLGSLAGGALADRLSRPRAVVAFGLCELGIALCAALSPLVFYDLVFGRLVGLAGSQGAVLPIVFAALLPPTLLMGLSLPLLARAVVRDIEGAAERIGWLYALNTFGAGIGALAAGTLVIGTIGYEATVYLGALCNAAVGLAALAIAGAMRDAGPARRAAGPAAQPAGDDRGRARLLGWCALVFASGFLIISLEIVWFRVLATLIETIAYAFPIILGTFLLADAAGILVGARQVRRVRDPLRLFLWLQGAVALYALAAMALLWALHGLDEVPRLFVDRSLGGSGASTSAATGLAWLAAVGLLVAPPAFLLGMSFPITQKAVQQDPDIVGFRVGLVQLANILGNTAGAVVTGLVLLHLLGTSGTLRAIGLLGLLLFTLVLLGGRRRAADAALGAALAAAVLLFPGNGAFWAALHGAQGRPATVVEDRSGIVVMRQDPDHEWMFIGGHAMSRLPFLPVHGALGALGPLLHPAPRNALIIGQGIGGTPLAAALAMPDPAARIHVIEIVRPVYAAVEQHAVRPEFAPVLRGMLADQRISRAVGDGRHAIFTDAARYDIIEADALSPRGSHSGLLYSVAFFSQVRDRLAPGGMAVQWGATPRVEASFLAAFPHVLRLTEPGSGNSLLVGRADGPVPYDPAALARRFEAVAPAFAAAGWSVPEVRARLLGTERQVWGPEDPRPAEVNTDLFPRDEYFLNRRKIDLLGGDPAARR